MKITIKFITVVIFSTTILFGQEANKKQKDNNSKIETGANGIDAPQVVEGNVIFSDGTNNLLRITDEGTTGAIEFFDGVPSDVTNKLYNNGSTLHFNGTALGSGVSSVDSLNHLADAKSGGYSIFLGAFAGWGDDGILNYNTAVGHNALSSNVSGASNIAIGFSALNKNEDHDNVAVGSSSLFRNVGGSDNIAVGSSTLTYNILGNHNTAIGSFAGFNSTGYNNIFIGYQAGFNETGNSKLYINNDSSSSPLIWGNFNTDSLKFNGNVQITGNLTFDGDLLSDSLKVNGFGHITKALSVGDGTKSSSLNSVAFGKNSEVLGLTSVSAGEDNAIFANNSAALGLGLRSSSYLSTIIGRYNENDIISFDNTTWVATEPLFVIGNGTDDANRANALTVLKNGNTVLNGHLDINGKASLGETANASGINSFAMGSNVNASGNGTIFLGDNSAASQQNATTDNRFAARFAGGYKFFTSSDLSSFALLESNQNSWNTSSDSTKKENFLKIDGDKVLDKISKFNLRSWNYKGQDPTKIRHYGPMAQEFFNAFGNDGIGIAGNDTTINSADFDGINLIAIQALEKRTEEQKLRIAELENRIEKLENQNQNLAKLNYEYRKGNSDLREDMMQIKYILSTMQVQNIKYKIASGK